MKYIIILLVLFSCSKVEDKPQLYGKYRNLSKILQDSLIASSFIDIDNSNYIARFYYLNIKNDSHINERVNKYNLVSYTNTSFITSELASSQYKEYHYNYSFNADTLIIDNRAKYVRY